MEIGGNETADQLARRGSSHLHIGPEPAFGISTKISRGIIRDWTCRTHKQHWQYTHEQRHIKGIVKRTFAKRAGLLLNLSRNQLKIMTWLPIGHCHLNGHPQKLRLIDAKRHL